METIRNCEYQFRESLSRNGDVYKKFENDPNVFLSNENIFEIFEKFWAEKFSNVKSENNPSMYIVGAQPGAGKTGLVMLLKNELEIIDLVGDIYRTYHPNYTLFMDSPNYSSFTGPLNGVMNLLTISRCLDRKISFIQETTFGNIDTIVKNIENAHSNNFRVNIMFLAVDLASSFLGTYYRASKLIENGCAIRLVAHEYHDKVYNNIFELLKNHDILLKLNSICVFNRNLEQLYKSKVININNLNTVIFETKETIEKERTRDKTESEILEIIKQKETILKLINKGLLPISASDFDNEYNVRRTLCKNIIKK